MAWIILAAAGLLEIGFAIALGQSDGFSRPLPIAVFLACGAASFALLSIALKTIPLGTAYVVWTGIGAAGTAIVGILFLGETAGLLRVALIALIVVAVGGLQLTGS